jgi:hypothetical protein
VVDKIEEIDVPVIDVSGASQPIQKSVNISEYLPEGVQLVDEKTANITVTAMVEEEGTRTINFMVSSIQINNLAEGLQVSYEPDAEIALRFSGDQKALEMLDISNAVSVDMSAYVVPGVYDACRCGYSGRNYIDEESDSSAYCCGERAGRRQRKRYEYRTKRTVSCFWNGRWLL